MHILIIIGDGMSDRPIKELNYKTPLQVANTPTMDRLAEEAQCGIMDPISPGIRCGSDTAHLAILGYDPYKTYTGRGPFEAAGLGLNLKAGDISLRCNFATIDENFIVVDRRAGRIKDGTDELAAAINGLIIDDVEVILKESVEHRAALVLRGKDLGFKVTDIDPHKEGLKIEEAKGGDKKSKKTAVVLNKLVRKSYEILNNHPVNKERVKNKLNPANIILPRGCGIAPDLDNFNKKYGFRSSCFIVEVALIKGIGRYLGIDIIDVEGATGRLDTDTDAIAAAVIENIKNYEFVLCNVKGADNASHDANIEAKIDMIERIDKMLYKIMNNLPADTYVVLCADHATPIKLKDHSGDAVPIAIYGEGVSVDKVTKFDELSCAEGALNRIRGIDLMNILTNLCGLQEKFGA